VQGTPTQIQNGLAYLRQQGLQVWQEEAQGDWSI